MGPVFQCDHKIVGLPPSAIERLRADFGLAIRPSALAKCLVPLLLLGVLERRSWGQTAPALTVERKSGAEGCPDVDALTSRVERIRGRAADKVKVGYQVTFAHDDDAWSATIRSSPDATGVRTLEDRGTTCAALAQATAVTLALLLDSDPAPAEEPTPAPSAPPPAPAPPPPKVPIAPVPSQERTAVYATLAMGGSAMAGVIRSVAPALSGEAGVSVARWHTGLGVLAVLPQDIALGPGVVRESLLSPFWRICYAPLRRDPWEIAACSGLYLGTLSAEGRNFSINTQQSRRWLAVPFELGATYGVGPIGVQAAAAALFPLQRQDFRIDNLGVAYESTALAAMFSLRLIGRLKL